MSRRLRLWGRWGLNSSSYSRLHGKGKSLLIFPLAFLLSRPDGGWRDGEHMQEGNPVAPSLKRHIIFYDLICPFFFFSVLFCSVPFFAPPVFYIPFAAMSCKWSLKCCWLCIELRRTLRRIQYNVKSCLQLDWTHQQCLPIYPLPSRVNVYICIYVMQLDLFRVASHSVASKSRTLSTPRIASIKGNEHFASWARVHAV